MSDTDLRLADLTRWSVTLNTDNAIDITIETRPNTTRRVEEYRITSTHLHSLTHTELHTLKKRLHAGDIAPAITGLEPHATHVFDAHSVTCEYDDPKPEDTWLGSVTR